MNTTPVAQNHQKAEYLMISHPCGLQVVHLYCVDTPVPQLYPQQPYISHSTRMQADPSYYLLYQVPH